VTHTATLSLCLFSIQWLPMQLPYLLLLGHPDMPRLRTQPPSIITLLHCMHTHGHLPPLHPALL